MPYGATNRHVFGAVSRVVLQAFASLENIAVLPFDQQVESIDR
jgi:hypothetical protein